MIQGIIFDFDNTLYNYEEANKIALDNLFKTISKETNITEKEINEYFNEIVLNIKKSNNYHCKFNKSIYIKYLLEKLNININKYFDLITIYDDVFYSNIKLYPNVIDILELLKEKNIKLGMVTNNIFSQQIKKIKQLQLLKYFDVIITSSECGYEKPNELIFINSINKMNIPVKNLCLIGDDYLNDIKPLEKIGITGFLFKNNDSEVTYDKYFSFGSFANLYIFFTEYFKTTDEIVYLSKLFGQSFVNVQGQGGNISIKLNSLIFIKSSGSILGNTSYDNGYTITHNSDTYPIIFGFKKPSMEIYFHSFMKKYVIHLHFILSNIFLCTNREDILKDFTIEYKIIDYEIPGKKLANNIYEVYDKEVDLYFLKNHGIIITGDTIEDIINVYNETFVYYNSKLNNRYELELLTFRINKEINDKFNKTIVCRIYKNNLKNIIYCFPDIAVYIETIEYINDITDIKNLTKIPDIIIYQNISFIIADNLTKLYSIYEILDAYDEIKLNSVGIKIQSIDNKTIQNMEEEKLRKII